MGFRNWMNVVFTLGAAIILLTPHYKGLLYYIIVIYKICQKVLHGQEFFTIFLKLIGKLF